MAKYNNNSKNEMKTDDQKQSNNNRCKRRSNKKSSKNDFGYKDKTSNDISWYSHNPQLIKDTCSIPFNNALGTKLNISNMEPVLLDTGSGMYNDIFGEYQPGFMILDFIPGPGKSTDGTSAANVAASNIYAYIRYANSGKTNYEAPDLMQYLLAMDSAYMVYNTIKRLIGLVNIYSATNRYIPQAIIEGLGFDFENCRANLPRLRSILNAFALQLNAFYVPATMDMFIRHSWMCSNVYADEPSSRAQMYLFNPVGYYVYDETLERGQLKYRSWRGEPDAKLNVDNIENILNAIIQSLITCQSFLIMGGDILKAYGSSKLFTVEYVTEAYSVLPVYNPEVLVQIENSVAVGGNTYEFDENNWRNTSITSDPSTGLLIYDPYIRQRYDSSNPYPVYADVNPVFNFHMDVVPPEAIMEATRLNTPWKAQYTVEDETVWVETHFTSLPAEVITQMHIFTWVEQINNTSEPFFYKAFRRYTTDSFLTVDRNGLSAGAAEDFYFIALLNKFAHHPLVYLFEQRVDASSDEFRVVFKDIIGDIDNMSVISRSQLALQHDVALLSLYGVPYRAQ